MTLAPASFVTGIASPVIIDSSTADLPSITTPSTGTFSPGRTRSRSPTTTASSGTSSSLPSLLMRRALFWRELDQRADRMRRRGPRAQFQHLAEQDQDGDDGGGLEIKRDAAVRMSWKAAGNNPGASAATTL